MDCAACASKIETAVSRIPGVSEVGASYTAGTLNVVHDAVQFSAIQNVVKSLGYNISPDSPALRAGDQTLDQIDHDYDHANGHLDPGDGPWWRTRKAILTLACGVALIVAYLAGRIVPDAGHFAF
ncbi:MAG: heavy metal translocating P-type ATPase, partial [Parvibaculum sp.]|nr:heavy metal translocating P-type ATPase [Parvibaculum sp.]